MLQKVILFDSEKKQAFCNFLNLIFLNHEIVSGVVLKLTLFCALATFLTMRLRRRVDFTFLVACSTFSSLNLKLSFFELIFLKQDFAASIKKSKIK
jgi:hypothetical protein